MKITDYRALRENHVSILQQKVIELIAFGWQPFGSLGVASCFDTYDNAASNVYTQAVVKYETHKEGE